MAPDRLLPESSEGEWLGGVLGVAWGGWLKVQFLWLTRRRAASGTVRD
jgi:hypothetical protein